MRGKITLYILALTLFSPGCSLFGNAARVLCTSIEDHVDDTLEHVRNRKWAAAAWQDVISAGGPTQFSADYACGFKDGFAEYLFRGGDGQPPVLPPSKYRKFCYQTPAGYKAIEDWFAGYRHGVAVAHDRGYRRFITGPVAFTPDRPCDPAPGTEHAPAASLEHALPVSHEATGAGVGARFGSALPVGSSADMPEPAVNAGVASSSSAPVPPSDVSLSISPNGIPAPVATPVSPPGPDADTPPPTGETKLPEEALRLPPPAVPTTEAADQAASPSPPQSMGVLPAPIDKPVAMTTPAAPTVSPAEEQQGVPSGTTTITFSATLQATPGMMHKMTDPTAERQSSLPASREDTPGARDKAPAPAPVAKPALPVSQNETPGAVGRKTTSATVNKAGTTATVNKVNESSTAITINLPPVQAGTPGPKGKVAGPPMPVSFTMPSFQAETPAKTDLKTGPAPDGVAALPAPKVNDPGTTEQEAGRQSGNTLPPPGAVGGPSDADRPPPDDPFPPQGSSRPGPERDANPGRAGGS